MIGALFLIALVVAAVYVVVCVVAGLQPLAERLSTFTPQIGPEVREFDHPAADVLDAYARAVPATAGMSLVERTSDQLLVDLRPTARILGECFGLGIRVSASDSGGGHTVLTLDAAKKVAFAWTTEHQEAAALLHAERSLRMAAKQHGIAERL